MKTKLLSIPNIRITRRGIQIALGLLWLLDGALQLQRQMFTANFANNVIAPTAQGQPVIVSGPVHFAVHSILLHPAIFDACFALIQFVIGLTILWKRTTKNGLIASVLWGLLVWYMGEGLAGLASGHATLLMGAPGAALLYAILALAVMPQSQEQEKGRIDNYPAYWLVFVWAIFWIGGAVYQLMPGQNSVSSLSSMIAGSVSGAPGWLGSLDAHIANAINGFGTYATSTTNMHMSTMQMARMPTQSGSGYLFILFLAFLQVCIGFAVFFRGSWRKLAIMLGIVLSLAFWVVGQSLGAYFSGLATDPNSGPLFVLLGVAVLGSVQLDKKLAHLSKRIEAVIV